MTIEEAIRILRKSSDINALGKAVMSDINYFHNLNEACRLATDELRKRQWISVKERLPEPTYQVLIYTADDWLGIDACDDNGEFMEYDYVTHWMPLPEPPKEG